MGTTSEDTSSAELISSLQRLEDRISRIEEHLGLHPEPEESNRRLSDSDMQQQAAETVETLENQIGETLFARLAILVLAIGIAFLLTFPFQGLPAALPALFGYALVAGAGTLSYRWRESLPQLSGYILAATLLLLYFTTLRLYFFAPDPPIDNKTVELVLLLLVVIISLVVSVLRRSPYLAGLSLAGGYVTALVSGEEFFVSVVCAMLSLGAVLLSRRYHWHSVLVFATASTYFTYMIWALGNPVMGNALRLVPVSPQSAATILLLLVILASGTLLRPAGLMEKGRVIVGSFLNGLAGYGLYFLLTIASAHASLYHTAASLVFLLLSILFWHRERSRYSTFGYAMLGYMALSVAIIAGFPRPEYFVWLACQSLLVISTAIWFRSRFIVGANFGIYLLLFVAYLFLAGRVSLVSIIFGLVALLSARILNWQKDRLELKTELMRNAYLATAFFVIPYALYHTVPTPYVSISWVVVAIFYFLLSILLGNNRKYRWMALLTLCLTIGYVFLVDIVHLDPAFRILSLLVLGLALFWISIVYTRKRTKRQPDHPGLSETSQEIPRTIHNRQE